MAEAAPIARKIRNAEVRYAERRAGSTVQSHLRGGHRRRPTRLRPVNDSSVLNEEEQEVLATLLEEELGIAKQDTRGQKITGKKQKTPAFPIMIVMLAVAKDLLDIPADLSLFGMILSEIFSLIISFILFLWVWGKMSGGWWKKQMIRRIWFQYILAMVIEFIPFVQMVPATTIFVLMAHYRNTKVVKLFNGALERMRKPLKKGVPGL